MPVSILKERNCLIASLQVALSDAEWVHLQDDLLEKVGRLRSRGVIIDVAVLDVMDSFAARTLRTIAQACRLRGAETVIVGIQPEIALTMVQLGWTTQFTGLETALDLEDGIALLERLAKRERQ